MVGDGRRLSPPQARNLGLRHSAGLDRRHPGPDDVMLPNRLPVAIDTLAGTQRPSPPAASCDSSTRGVPLQPRPEVWRRRPRQRNCGLLSRSPARLCRLR